MEPPTAQASPKEKFDLLFGLLKDHYAGLIDFQFKHGAVLTLFVGWMIASKDAQTFVRDHHTTALFGCAVLLVYVGCYSRWVWTFYQRSLLTYQQLWDLNFMPADYFKLRRIPLFTVVSFIALHWLAILLILSFGISSRPNGWWA